MEVHPHVDQELLQQGHGEIRYEAKIVRADGALRDIYVTKALIADADVPRLGQALRKLLANAIRFSPASSTIDIEFESRTLEGSAEIELRIADRGPGIPPEELDSLFEAFVQSSKTQDGAGGTGLGLTISRRIIEAHDGRLWASNRVGGGAVFTLVLPAAA